MFKKLYPVFVLALVVLLTACNEDAVVETVQPSDQDLTATEDVVSAEFIDQEVEEIIDAVVETRDPSESCLEVTFLNPRGTFPNKITLDFGDGCEGPRGHVRSGKILIDQSDRMHVPGAIRTVTFEEFTFDDLSISGGTVLTNTAAENGNQSTYTKEVDVLITFPDGSTVSRTAFHQAVQIAGGETSYFRDDVFEVTINSTLTGRDGGEITVTTLEPLIRDRSCRWITDGLLQIEKLSSDGMVSTRTIDYGYPNDGACDNLALVTLDDGTEKEIRIHRRRW